MRKFQENSLLENVNLCVNHNLRKHSELLHALAQILPLISSIHTIQIDSPDINLFKMVYDNKNTNHDKSNSHQLLLKEMMEKTRIMLIRWLFLLCSWIFLKIMISTGSSLTLTRGKLKWIGTSLGFTRQQMMGNRECCELLMISIQQLIVTLSLNALKRHIYFKIVTMFEVIYFSGL
jgi:hypothetical protein